MTAFLSPVIATEVEIDERLIRLNGETSRRRQ